MAKNAETAYPETIPSNGKHDASLSSERQSWQHWSLRRSTFISFAAILLVLIIIFAILNLYSNRNNGICTAGERDHYVWTYLPTAIFMLLAAVWSNTDYRAKQMQPWACMAHGSQPASQSVLLDYISPMNIIVLLRASYRRHYLAALTVAITLGFQLNVALSTGLFFLSNLQQSDIQVHLQTTQRFIANTEVSEYSGINPNVLPWATVLSFSDYDLRPPLGTTHTKAFQLFTPPGKFGSNVTSTAAIVDVFSSTLACEPANITFRVQKLGCCTQGAAVVSATAPTCPLDMTAWQDTPNIDFKDWGTWALFDAVSCQQSPQKTTQGGLLLAVGSVEIQNSTVDPNITALFCEPQHRIDSLPATMYRNSTVQIGIINEASKPRRIPGLSSFQLAFTFARTLNNNEFKSKPLLVENPTGGPWASLNLYDPPTSIAEYRDSAYLESWLQSAWARYSAQMANLRLKQSEHSALPGTISANKDRLVIRGVAFWLIESSLAVQVLLLVLLCVTRTHDLVPRDVASIVGLGTVLAPSSQFLKTLANTGQSNNKELRELLGKTKCFAMTNSGGLLSGEDRFLIDIDQNNSVPQHETSADRKSKQWYHPFPSRWYYRAGTPSLVIAVIIVLELLYRKSVSSKGLADVPSSVHLVHLAWTYLPTSTMIAIASLVSMLHFCVKIFQPYSSLWKGSSRPANSILRYSFGTATIWKAARNREVAMLATAALSVAASLLAIAASGLYTSKVFTSTTSVSVSQADWFLDRTFGSQKAGLVTAMVTAGIMSLPKYAYENLAIARLNPQFSGNVTSFSGTVPALRGTLNCSAIPNDRMLVNQSHMSTYQPSTTILPITLLDQGHLCHNTFIGYIPESGYFGSLETTYDWAGSWLGDKVYGEMWGGSDSQDPSCPKVYGILAKISPGPILDNLTFFTCRPSTERVMAHVTLDWPSMEIDKANPPTVDEASAKLYNMSFDRGQNAANPVELFYEYHVNSRATSSLGSLDNFMDTLVSSTYGTPISELIGPYNVDRLLAAMEKLYGLGFVLLIDGVRTADISAGEVSGTTTQTATRLVQSELSTRALQALLGVILLLLIISFSTMNVRKVLPKNPNSIAAVASLLAGSKLIDVIALAPQDLSDEALIKTAALDKWTYSLGWWREGTNVNRRFGIDVGIADRAI